MCGYSKIVQKYIIKVQEYNSNMYQSKSVRYYQNARVKDNKHTKNIRVNCLIKSSKVILRLKSRREKSTLVVFRLMHMNAYECI